MKKQFVAVLTMALITLAASGNLLLAQMLTVDVPFEFNLEDKTLPAGNYEIRRGKDDTSLTLRNLDTGDTTFVPFITRLGSRSDKKGSIVFDKSNGISYLSEVYLPGLDGFYLKGAPGEHEHSTVKSKN